MRYAIVGGDMRFAYLAQLLGENGRFASAFLQERAGGDPRPLQDLAKFDCIISNWPVKTPLSDQQAGEGEILAHIAPGSVLLLCGPGFPGKKRWDLQYVNLWADEILLLENAWLTAEAAVAGAAADDIRGANCMVIGYGRIGRALNQLLLNLGANVTVISRCGEKRRAAEASGAAVAAPSCLRNLLPGQKVIFSTPPARMLDPGLLECVSRDAALIDLASPPYGFDLAAARKLGLNARREPGLPGRYCPQDAARVLCNAIVRWEEGEGDET